MKKEDLGYLAGYFDGEGSISIDRNYALRCSVVSVNRWSVEFFRFNFGGGITIRPATVRPFMSQSESYQWHIHALNAMKFLKVIVPYLRLKKAEALLAIDFQTKKEQKKSIGRTSGLSGRVTDEELAVREATRIIMQNLKRPLGHNVKPPKGKEHYSCNLIGRQITE